MSRTILIIWLLSVILAFPGCANNPVTRSLSLPLGRNRTALDQQQADLNTMAEVHRPGTEKLVIRFREKSLFDSGQYQLRTAAEQNLRQIAEVLKKYPDSVVVVAGHADNVGPETYNQWLSEKRSWIVADFLVNNGLNPERIQVIGYGESQPIATNRTANGRRLNRRVELQIIADEPSP